MKVDYRLGAKDIKEVARYLAKELTLRNKQFDPTNPKAFVEFFFKSYNALLKELSSQNEKSEQPEGGVWRGS